MHGILCSILSTMSNRIGIGKALVALVVVGLVSLLGGCFFVRNQPPVARLSATPCKGPAPLTVEFDARSSYDPDGTITSWDWSFGESYVSALYSLPDWHTGLGTAVMHTYVEPGDYTVYVRVEDDDGETVTASLDIIVTDYTYPTPLPEPDCFYRHYEWNYESQWTWDVCVPRSLYYNYKSKPRTSFWDAVTDNFNYSYDQYVLDPLDDPYLSVLAQRVEETQNGDYYRTLESLLYLVQAAIDYKKDIENQGFDDYPQYPLETLVEEAGDCEDTAILYASLVRPLGYGALISCCLVDQSGAIGRHMVALVPVHETYAATLVCPSGCERSFWWYEGQLYALAETARDPDQVGYIPLGCEQSNWIQKFEYTWDVRSVDISPKLIKWGDSPGRQVEVQ